MDYVIREAKSADVPTLIILFKRLAEFELPPKRSPEVFYAMDVKMLEAWERGETPNVFVHVAEGADGTLLGVTMVSLQEEFFDHSPSAHLEVVAVAQSADGLGVGKALIANAESEARTRGAGSMSLHVVANNERARHVYKTIGYNEELIRCIKHFE